MDIQPNNKTQIFHKRFYYALKSSLISMRNHAEAQGLKTIRLAEIGCGLDKLQSSIVKKNQNEVFQEKKIGITVCIRRHNLMKRKS